MLRQVLPPRANAKQRMAARGFTFVEIDGRPYWDESACYVFKSREIEVIEQATYALHEMCLALVQHVINEKMYGLFLIPDAFIQLVERSWNEDETSIYGRFDLAYDGSGPPKLLEYNADTPTALLEAAVIQWDWLQDVDPAGDQFNSIDERLVESAWPAVLTRDEAAIHFTAMTDSLEDVTTLEYLRDTAVRAGAKTQQLDLAEIAWDAGRGEFRDPEGAAIHRIFKLYPWEWLIQDDFGRNIPRAQTVWLEPAWKMILSSKAILPLLWDMFPDSPYLVPASFDPIDGDHVKKPVHSREGSNIEVVRDGVETLQTDGPYDGPVVYQQFVPIRNFDGNVPILGSWVVNGWACGVGIREDESIVTGNASRFVPHKIGS